MLVTEIIIQYLIRKSDCILTLLDNSGNMAIHTGVLSGQLNVVMHLISNYYFSPNCSGKWGQTPLHLACIGGHVSIIQYLSTKLDFWSVVDIKSLVLLKFYTVCSTGVLSILKKSLTPNSTAHFLKICGQMLHKACENGFVDIVRYLVSELGCDPASPDNDGDLPIHIACVGGQLNVVKYLITNNYCSPDNKGKWGRTPLHHACDKGHMNIVQYLISESGCTILNLLYRQQWQHGNTHCCF